MTTNHSNFICHLSKREDPPFVMHLSGLSLQTKKDQMLLVHDLGIGLSRKDFGFPEVSEAFFL